MWRKRGDIVSSGDDLEMTVSGHGEEQASMEKTWRLLVVDMV
jgi:hypothetical protein